MTDKNLKSKLNLNFPILLILLMLLFSISSAPAATYVVNTTDDNYDGNCDSSNCSLREALHLANANAGADTINFSVTGIINLAEALPNITDSVTITGPGASQLTVRRDSDDGSVPYSIFSVTTGEVNISGLTISNGLGHPQGGGGIFNTGGTVSLSDSVISDNLTLYNGGGIWNSGTFNIANSTISNNRTTGSGGLGGGIYNTGTLNITNSTVNGNLAHASGGGIYTILGSTVTITESTISGNTANFVGGGIFSADSTTTVNVTGSTIRDNSALQAGGGIYTISGGAITITNSSVENNFAGNGGGGIASFNNSAVNIISSTFSGNSTGIFAGGGVANANATLNVQNSTISGNTAASVGGGIINTNGGTTNISNSTISHNSALGTGGIYNNSGTVNLKSSIIALNSASNTGNDLTGTIISQGYNVVGSTLGAAINQSTGDQFGVSALQLNLGQLQNNGGPTKTHALLSGSIAIDAGTANGLLTDQRGFNRTVDFPGIANASDGTDVGAFEASLPTVFNFSGFLPPIDASALNLVNAGSSVPIKFSLGGDFGLAIFAAGSPSSQVISCAGSGSSGVIEETAATGSSSLSYDPLTDQYTYVWKTEKSWKNTCRQLSVQLSDGSTYTADFRYK